MTQRSPRREPNPAAQLRAAEFAPNNGGENFLTGPFRASIWPNPTFFRAAMANCASRPEEYYGNHLFGVWHITLKSGVTINDFEG